jgi:hypothetical protein
MLYGRAPIGPWIKVNKIGMPTTHDDSIRPQVKYKIYVSIVVDTHHVVDSAVPES